MQTKKSSSWSLAVRPADITPFLNLKIKSTQSTVEIVNPTQVWWRFYRFLPCILFKRQFISKQICVLKFKSITLITRQ